MFEKPNKNWATGEGGRDTHFWWLKRPLKIDIIIIIITYRLHCTASNNDSSRLRQNVSKVYAWVQQEELD